MTPADREHAEARRLLPLFVSGLLEGDGAERFGRHVLGCADCRAELDDLRSPEANRGRHVPDAMIARWPEARTELRGLQRELVRRHLARCEECGKILRHMGYSPELERVSELEPSAPLLAMLDADDADATEHGHVAETRQIIEIRQRILTLLTPIRRAWTQPWTRVLAAGGLVAAAAALVIVLVPLGVTRRDATSRMARVTPRSEPEGSPKPIPTRLGGPPSTPGTPTGRPPIAPSEEQVATRAPSAAETTGAVTPHAPPQTTPLAAAPPPAGTPNPPAVPPSPVVAPNAASLLAVTRLHGELPTTAAAASEALERALASSGAARVVTPDSFPRFAVEFELSPLDAAPAPGRASRAGAEQPPLPAPPAGTASLRYRIVDQWTGEVSNGSIAKVSVAALDGSAGPVVERLTSALARQLWAGRVASVADGEIVIRGEGQAPPRVGDKVAIVEHGRDILDERTGGPAGFLITPVAIGTVVAIVGQSYNVRTQHASRHIKVGMLATRRVSR